MKNIKVEIPIKPISVNQAFQGRRFNTPEKKAFEQQVDLLLPPKEMIKGKISIHYKFYLKNHSRIDYDNCLKVVQDCLVTKGYFEDDRKIYKALIEKIESKEDKIVIEIKEVN